MPGKVKVKIISGRNLPVMDRSSDTTDAYVEIKLGTTTYKTDVCRKSLHPQWNSEWYRFEMDDSELQDEPLQIRLMDHDTYSANDAIGKVYLDLNPLLLPATSLLGKWNDNSVMSGWIPVYDTMHGIRGEVNVIVKVELFTDFNKFRQSSCGVQFFCSPAIPHGFYAQVVHGFVEELVVNDDPEYQWIDKIRTPRASNEARQTLFYKLSGELQRKIGLKALDMGGNSVIGYNQCFDLEGESGIVARGIGTAVTLVKIMDLPSPNVETTQNDERTQNYLKFLGSAKGFFLNNDSNLFVDKFKQFPDRIPSPSASIRSLKLEQHVERMPRHLTRHLSDREFNFPLAVPDKKIHHTVSLQTLLKQEDQRGKPSQGISQRFKKLKYTSQNMLSRKMTALKAKLADTSDTSGDPNELAIEPQTRSLLKYRRTQSDSTGMAEILVRSVYDATTSLGCIAESPKVSVDEAETMEKEKDSSFLSLPTPVMEGDSPTSNVSCVDSSSSADDDDDDDDEEEDDEDADQTEGFEVLDTISHIVETVRKFSIQQTSRPEPHQLDDYNENIMFIVDDGEEQRDKAAATFELVDEDDSNLMYYEEGNTVNDVKMSESFLPQFTNAFQMIHSLKKSSTVRSLSDINVPDQSLNKKFVSLHNIHDATSKMNKYSAHSGKDTVLGELFKRIDNARPQSPEIVEIDQSTVEVETVLEHKPECESSVTSLNEDHKHGLLHKLKEGGEMLMHGPKELFHRLDSKIHHVETPKAENSNQQQQQQQHGMLQTALGNVLMESVNEILATCQRDSNSNNNKTKMAHNEKQVNDENIALSSASESGELKRSNSPKLFIPCQETMSSTRETKSLTPEDNQQEGNVKIKTPHSAGFLHTKLFRPHKVMNALHMLDKEKSCIKNEHGLLNIALGNVLMDSVQDVLATSHSETPKTPTVASIYLHEAQSCNLSVSVAQEQEHHQQIIQEHDNLLADKQIRSLDCQSTPLHSECATETSSQMKPHDSDEHKHGLMYKLKEGKEMILHAPKELFRRLDYKIHEAESTKAEKSAIKNEHGLLNIALGNVLMDSVQEVLATSHSESSQSNPEIPFRQVTDPRHETKSLVQVQVESPGPSQLINIPNAVDMVNTKVDKGNSDCINTKHACLTNLRNVDTPPTDTRIETAGGHQRTESLGVRISHSPAKLNSIPCIHRRSSDSDLSITPKGFLRKRNSLTGSDRSGGYSSGQCMRNAMIRTTVPQENFDIMEYPFLTMSKYPPGFIAYIGGSVSARSVKLLERISNLEEPESRDTWWSEIRMEIRSHARSLNCNAVLGYTETTSICDDVCVLSASGTAAIIGYQYSGEASDNIGGLPVLPKTTNTTMTTSLDRNDFEKDKQRVDVNQIGGTNTGTGASKTIAIRNPTNANSSPEKEKDPSLKPSCTICHLPYFSNVKPLRSSAIKCSICGAFKVPDMLIATIESPEGMPSIGRGCFVQSYVCRPLKDLKGESNAKEISDGLPFLEYELHRFLINKLKVKGMNAIFGLKVRISVGERMLIGIATGTAVFLSPLPPPLLPKLVSDRTTDEKKLTQLQKNLHDTIKKNREIYQLRSIEEVTNEVPKLLSDTDDSEDEQATLDLSMGNKDCCILEVDDPDDVDVLNSLMEPRPPDGFHVVNTEQVPGLEDLEIVKNLQMFTQIWRAKIPPPFNIDKHFHRLLQSVYFKLRRMIPCALCDLQFRVDSPEPDEIQLCVLGMALGLGDPFKNPKVKRKNVLPKRNDDDLIFNLEEDQIPEHSVVQTPPAAHYLHAQTLKHRQKSPIRNRLLTKQRHVPYRERHGVDITPLSYVPGGKIEKYLGNLNFFFIRETTSLREEGGLSGFVHSFVTEVLAIVRAHVTALGGNAMVAYFITECVLNHNLHKNQGQCLINVGGDVVYVSYFTEEH